MVSKDINKIECEKAFVKMQLNSIYGDLISRGDSISRSEIKSFNLYKLYKSYNRRIKRIKIIGRIYK